MTTTRPHIIIGVPREDEKSSAHSSPKVSMFPRRGKNPGDYTKEPWLLDGSRKYAVPKKGEPWEKCYRKVKDFDEDLTEGWRDEIDKLLIFAGLFSSAVTAFVIEAYQRLQEDPVDKNTWLLEQILLEVHNSNTGNISPDTPLPIPPKFSPSAIDIRLNVYWFMSLSLSLATVLIGILCIQWLREYDRNSPLDPKEAIALRQLRYEGLIAWKVPGILMSLPVLLHLSLILFFVGLLDLLWSLNNIVAFFVTIVSGLVLLFVFATTLLPALQHYFIKDNYLRSPQCAFKSPQAWVIHRFVTGLVQLSRPASSLFKTRFRDIRYKPFFNDKNWVDYDTKWREIRSKAPSNPENINDIAGGLAWIDKHLGQGLDMVYSVYHCIRDLDPADGAKVVSQISEKHQGHLASPDVQETLKVMPPDARREFISALFLETNNRAFPQVDSFQLESIVRIVNTRINNQDNPTPMRRDSSRGIAGDSPQNNRIDPQIADSLPFTRWPLDYVRGMPTDLVTQFLLCMKILIDRSELKESYVKDMWTLIHLILSASADGQDKGPRQSPYAQLAWEIVGAIEASLENEAQVRAFASQLIKAFPAGDPSSIGLYGKPVIEAMNIRLKGLGGVLSPTEERRWAEIQKGVGLSAP